MEVEVEDEGKIEVPEKSQVSTVVKKLNYHLDSVIVLSEGEPLPLDKKIEEDITIKILPVVSGG